MRAAKKKAEEARLTRSKYRAEMELLRQESKQQSFPNVNDVGLELD